jgi:putative transposase
VLRVSRSNVAERASRGSLWRDQRGRRATEDPQLTEQLRDLAAQRPTYGYRRLWALLRRLRARLGQSQVNAKRVYRLAKANRLLLQRHTGLPAAGPAHEGVVAVERSDQRYCSDAFEIRCDNDERVNVVFSLDCCDRQAIAFAATTAGVSGELVRDVMIQTLVTRFGPDPQRHLSVEWLSDNGSGYIACDTRSFARDMGLVPRRTPYRSPQSNGMAESFVKTFKRDYVAINAVPSAEVVLKQLQAWFDDYNRVHPHQALKYRSPDEFRQYQSIQTACPES